VSFKKNTFIIVFCFVSTFAKAQKNPLIKLLEANPQYFGHIVANPARYEVQVLYTQINRDKNNKPNFKTFAYQVDDNRYFYPASTVKMPMSFLALERLNALRKTIPELTKATPYRLDSTRHLQIPFDKNPLAANQLPSIEQDIKEVFIVSDNYAYNHLLDFLGRDYVNQKLEEKGYNHSRIVHRFSIPGIDNRFTPPMTFYQTPSQILLRQGEQVSTRTYQNPQHSLLKGKGYLNANDSLILAPFDFSSKNYFSLQDQQQMLRAVLFPASVEPSQRFDLSEQDYQFLYRYMSILPRESIFPTYDTTYFDGYCKFLMWGDDKKERPSHIRIFNKVGDAYGYMIDNAYIVDYEKNIEFMLSAVILCNEDMIFNDGKYEYESIGQPFFGHLGRVIYEYECQRKRKFQPDLSLFKAIKY
jgi:hypothetical protein